MRFVLNWGTFIVVLIIGWSIVGPTALSGPASYVIVDGRSMEPTYHDGDLVIARERATYEIGDVVVYDAPIDTQFNVIHRIVEPTEGGFVTQGDNMDKVDGWIAPHETIYGSAWFHIPNGGIIVAWLRQPAIAAALAAGLVTFELAKRSEKKEKEQAQAEPSEVAA